MLHTAGSYWTATRHPWSCVLFVVPILAIYEIGLHFLGPTPVEALRNGADAWLRSGLAAAGIAPCTAPAVLLVILLTWVALYREPLPADPVSVWSGMLLESVVFAGLLYGLSQGLWPFIRSLCGVLEVRGAGRPLLSLVPLLSTGTGTNAPDPAFISLVRFLGAGIYEETLFRLLLFSGLLTALTLADFPGHWSIGLAALASALMFAGAHNLGPQGEAFQGSLFLFRTVAGVYFAWLYCVRGFGIAVGAHAGYDVLVGLLLREPG